MVSSIASGLPRVSLVSGPMLVGRGRSNAIMLHLKYQQNKNKALTPHKKVLYLFHEYILVLI